jgi:hypothetical protein
MRSLAKYSLAAVVLLLSSTVIADEPCTTSASIFSKCSLVCPDALLRGCCCIYCPKPLPCVPCLCCCCPDDYCCKPCPCIPCYHGGVCDCYCPKPCPDLCRPIAANFYTCDAGASCEGCVPACRVSKPLTTDEDAPLAVRLPQPSPPESGADQSQLNK